MERKSLTSSDDTVLPNHEKSENYFASDQKSTVTGAGPAGDYNYDKNSGQICVDSCPISSDDSIGDINNVETNIVEAGDQAPDLTAKNCEKNVERDIATVVCREKIGERKSDSDVAREMFTTVEVGLRQECDSIKQDKNVNQMSSKNINENINNTLNTVAEDTVTAKQSPNKSPGYVRKPMPINEPKPILPKSKQINLDQTSPTTKSSSSNVVLRNSSEENNNVETRRIVQRKLSSHEEQVTNNNNNKDICSNREGNKTKITEDMRLKKCSTSPLSPRIRSKIRPSTLMLDKREKFKRSSAVSATPSSDSSKSSKTFEFIDYDEETKEKILQDALKEEEEFLEFVQTLDIEPPDPIIEAGRETNCNEKSRHPSDSRSYLPGSRGKENLDSLCRMMEEIAHLKDQNNKLNERLHYIEISSRLQYHPPDTAPDVRTWLAETSNDGGTVPAARCRSVGTESQFSDKIPKLEEVSSPHLKSKFRKWGKMKEAFKWERSPSEQLQPSNLPLSVSPTDDRNKTDLFQLDDHIYEEANNIPRSSSVDYLNKVESSPTTVRRRHSLTNLKDADQEDEESKKEQQSTWLKVKNFITYNRRESLKKKSIDKQETEPLNHPVSTTSDYEYIDDVVNISDISSDQRRETSRNRKGKNKNPDLVFCNPDLYENKGFSQSLNSVQTDQNTDSHLLSPNRGGEETSHSLPSSPHANTDDVFFYEENINDDTRNTSKTDQLDVSTDSREIEQVSEIQRDYEQLKRSLSEEFNKKMTAWGQKKSSRDGGCQSVTDESQLSAEFRKKLDEWQRIKRMDGAAPSGASLNNDDVVVQLQQERSQELEFPSFPWHKTKEKSVKTTDNKPSSLVKIRARPAEQKTLVEEDLKPEFKLKVAEWAVQKAMAGHSNRTTEEISKLMPEDFNKKYREWEQIKVAKPGDSCNRVESAGEHEKKMKKKRKSQERWVNKSGKKVKEDRGEINAPEVGTFAWLDKELQKIDREKQRLERERLKTVERESRLLAMRQALGHQPPAMVKKEITVKTAAGEEFKFEGINPKFIKKLYDWDSKRGIAPDRSTITLLQSGINADAPDPSTSGHDIDKPNVDNVKHQNTIDLDSSCENLSRSSPDLTVPERSGAGVSVTRTDSVKTQSSLKLIHEKMSLLANLQAKADQCRYLESQLDSLGNKMSYVAKSRAELAQIKLEEETTSKESDLTLLSHLDRKLGSLEQEQTDLIEASYDIKASLTVQSEAQATLTKQLINKIGMFSDTQKGKISGETFGMNSLVNIQNLSAELEHHAFKLEQILHDRNTEISALKSRLTSELNDLESVDVIGTPPPKIPSPIFSDIPIELFETIHMLKSELTVLAKEQEEHISSFRKLWKQKSYSESDINSCEEYVSNSKRNFSGYTSPNSRLASMMSSSDSHCHGLASSNNSLSHYGSEVGLDLYDRAEHLKASLSENLINNMMREEDFEGSNESINDQLILNPPVLKTTSDRQNSKCSSGKSRTSKKSRRTSSDNVSTPTSLRSRSSSIISTADENDELLLKEEIDELKKSKTDIDKLFDVVHDLKQKDLEEHKRKIEQHKKEEVGEEPEPEPEKYQKKEDTVYNFKHLRGLRDVRVLNLGKKEDLAKILVPTKSMKIEPGDSSPVLTSDIQSLVVKTTACRIYAFDDKSSHDQIQQQSAPIVLHIDEEEEMCKEKPTSTNDLRMNQDMPVTNSACKSSQILSIQNSKQSLTPPTRKSNTRNLEEVQGLNVPKPENLDHEQNISKSSSPLSSKSASTMTPSFSLKQSASSPGFSNIAKEVPDGENMKETNKTKKSSFQLPPLDPAVEIICKNWRCNTPTSPASVDLSRDSSLSSALEARNKRIKKTYQARQQFLFSGPGGLIGSDSVHMENDNHDENDDVDVEKPEVKSLSEVKHQEEQPIDLNDDATSRNFVVEKSLSSDQVVGLRHSQSDKKLSKSSHSSLFTRLRRGQLGSSRTKMAGDSLFSSNVGHRLSLGLSEHHSHVTSIPAHVPHVSSTDPVTSNVSKQGSQSCPSSPSINRRRRSKKWKNVFKSNKTSR